jgi:hypothetical protein
MGVTLFERNFRAMKPGGEDRTEKVKALVAILEHILLRNIPKDSQ